MAVSFHVGCCFLFYSLFFHCRWNVKIITAMDVVLTFHLESKGMVILAVVSRLVTSNLPFVALEMNSLVISLIISGFCNVVRRCPYKNYLCAMLRLRYAVLATYQAVLSNWTVENVCFFFFGIILYFFLYFSVSVFLISSCLWALSLN